MKNQLNRKRIGGAGAIVALALAALLGGGCAKDTPEPAEHQAASGVNEKVIDGLTRDITGVDSSLVAPYGTSVLSVSEYGVQIYWKRPEGVEAYEVQRSYDKKGGFETLAYVSSKTYTYTDDTIDDRQRVAYYRVRSLVADGVGYAASPWSDLIKATYLDEVVLTPELWYMPHDDTCELQASYGWGEAPDLTWSVEDESVATVDEQGVVTAVAAGKTQVTCFSRKTRQAAKATIVVDRPEPTMLEEPKPRYVESKKGVWTNPSAKDTGDATLVMVGDLMCMGPQLRTHYSELDGYNFNESYAYTRRILKGADLAVGNLESVVTSAYPYSGETGYVKGKPICNAPGRFLDALRHAGFDLLCMANNHNADMGVRGVALTLNQVDRYLFARTGLFASDDEDRTMLVEVNGIKVGFVAYVDKSCGYNHQDDAWSAEDRAVLLNYYSQERAKRDIEQLRKRGAEYIIGYLHWGVKNNYEPGLGQLRTSQELADLGMDYIVGSHPHLVQRYEELTAADGRKVPCIFSLGDFNSYLNQVEGNLDTIMLRIRLHRTKQGDVVLAENAYIPCHIYRQYGDQSFVTIPINSSLNGGAKTPGGTAALKRIAEQVGDGLPEYQPE